jgi:hypothetical protein
VQPSCYWSWCEREHICPCTNGLTWDVRPLFFCLVQGEAIGFFLVLFSEWWYTTKWQKDMDKYVIDQEIFIWIMQKYRDLS